MISTKGQYSWSNLSFRTLYKIVFLIVKFDRHKARILFVNKRRNNKFMLLSYKITKKKHGKAIFMLKSFSI